MAEITHICISIPHVIVRNLQHSFRPETGSIIGAFSAPFDISFMMSEDGGRDWRHAL